MTTIPEHELLDMVIATRDYTAQQVQEALLAYAVTGNAIRASDVCGVPERTIRDFRHRFPQAFLSLAAKHSDSIEKDIVASTRENVIAAADAVHAAIQLEHTRLTNGETKDAAGAARNLATVAGIGVRNILELEGRPTSIIHHITGDEAMNRLEHLGVITDAEVIETDKEPTKRVSAGGAVEQGALE